MTRPGQGRYDPRILKHPEYHRSYHHYLRQGTRADEAARLAYIWTERAFPGITRYPQGRQEKVLAGVIVAVLAVFAVGFAANQPDGGSEDTAVPVAATPVPSPTAKSPTPSASPTAPVPVTTAPRPLTTRPRPPAPKPPAPQPVAPQPVAPRPPAPKPPAPKPPARPACEPSYPDACLRSGIGDYDCETGSGNGPNYVRGPIKVLPPDPFDLDRNGDGVGCERG
jgi:hypothetical protein